MKRITIAAVGAALAIAAACSDNSPSAPVDTTPILPQGLVISNARVNVGTGSSVAAGALAASSSLNIGAGALAYISAVPGTFPGAIAVAVRNQTRAGASRSVPVIDGGIDPFGIEAAAGDELSLLVRTINGVQPMFVKVPPRRPPGVVRTNPPKGRSDVALSVQVLVVFSEPIDASSATASSIALNQNGNPLSGHVQVSADGLSAEFIPDVPLQPKSEYALVINAGIHDMDGDALGETLTVTFETSAAPVGTTGTIAMTSVTTATTSSELDPDGYTVAIDGSPQHIGINGALSVASLQVGAHAVTLSDMNGNCVLAEDAVQKVEVLAGTTTYIAFHITCAPLPPITGRLAFVSERDGNSEIYAINADGTDLVRLTSNAATDVDPAWSPDGTRIAFVSNRDAGQERSDIYVMDADGSNVVRLTFGSINIGPSWSPDGSKIAFTSDWRAYDFVYDLYVARTDGSGITTLLEGPFLSVDALRFYFQPAWSPDGRRIAVVVCGYAWDDCYPTSTIAVANADGSELKTLAQTGGFARPAWSPDGSVIAFGTRSCRDPRCVGSLQYIWVASGQSGVISSNGHSPSWRP
jgi:hypothetical protein